tara:strand:+ start:239 stop:502 length:264 start_codon:yes stop_codon:yes gene_type:complete
MKNLFLSLAFMLIGTVASANEHVNSNLEKFENLVILVNGNTINQSDSNLNQVFEDCTMTIKNNKTGDSYTITVHGKSCGELIKEIMK